MAIDFCTHQIRRERALEAEQTENVARRCTLAELDAAESPAIEPPRLPRGRARHKLARGIPLLDGETFDPDLPSCLRRFGRLIDALQRDPERGAEALGIARAVDSGRLDFERAVGEALANHADHLGRLAAWSALPAPLLTEVFELTVRACLRAVAESLAPLLAEADCWQRDYCPLCGAAAALAEVVAGQPGARLRCVRCATGWPVQTLRCWSCRSDASSLASVEQSSSVDRCALQRCLHCGVRLRLRFAADLSRPADLAALDETCCFLDHAGTAPAGTPRGGYRLELGEPEPDETLDDLLESD